MENANAEVLATFEESQIRRAIEANGRLNFLHGSTGTDEHRGIRWSGRFVLDTQVEPEEADSAIDEVLDRLRQAGVSPRWRIGPTSRPADLARRLEDRGFTCSTPDGGRDEMPGMAIDLDHVAPAHHSATHLKIRHVEDRESLQGWVHFVGPHFGIGPDQEDMYTEHFLKRGLDWPFRFYAGYADGKLVATAQMFLAAGVAGLSYMLTDPKMRKQGLGATMLFASMSEVRDRGYRVVVLDSSPDGYDFYRRIGFEEYCKLRTYSLS